MAASPVPLRIIGVAPPGFAGARRGERTDVWIPSNLMPSVAPAGDNIQEDGIPTLVIGRLHPGQTFADTRRRLLEDADDDWLLRRSLERTELVPLDAVFGSPLSRTIVIREAKPAAVVAGLAGLVLVAGCVTLMALVLVHYERRRRELAVRLALGASRGRLAAELSRELAWIAGGGIAGALLIGVWSLRGLPALTLPGGVDLSRLDLSLDWRVMAMALAITLLTLAPAAWLPIARFTRERLAGELIGTTATTSASSHRLRQALLAVHVGATIVVLVAAGLFVRAVQHGFSAGAGFDVDRTLFVHVQLAAPFVTDDTDMDARDALMDSRRRRLEDGLRALPGVEIVALGHAPLGPDQVSLLLAHRTVATNGEARDFRIGGMNGSPDLLDALGVLLLAARPLAAEDASARPRRVLVTQSLARALWPHGEPLGQILTSAPPGPGVPADARSRLATSEVVGVVADFAYGTLADPPAGVIVSVRPGHRGMLSDFVVRTSRPDLLKEPIRRLIQDVMPDVSRLVMETGREVVAQDLGRQRLGAWFFSGFGLIALLPVGAGVAAGLLAAALVARVFVSILPGLSALDLPTYVGVASLMFGCALAAALTAAWRLRRIAPADALRAE